MSGSSAAFRYHEATKHSPRSVAASRHRLDAAIQPLPFKVYRDLARIDLPTGFAATARPALLALRETVSPEAGVERLPALEDIARLCILSNGITRLRRLPGGGQVAFRAAGTTGALYHVELYVVSAELPGLPAGVYHFGAHDDALHRLRSGDHRALLVDASGGEPAVVHAPLVMVATSTFWRNAWKYEARAWRHTFWDTGTALANLLALASASNLPARVVLGFADASVNDLLGVDGVREAAVCLVALGHSSESPVPAPPLTPIDPPTLELSRREVRYPEIEDAQAATTLDSGEAASAWRSGAIRLRREPVPPRDTARLELPPPADEPTEPIEVVIRRRGSTRRFAPTPIGLAPLATMLECATAPVPADVAPPGQPLGRLHLIVNAVDGLAPGGYAVSSARGRIGLTSLRSGGDREYAGWLALGQQLGADAAVNLYWLADLVGITEALGDRGYRAAQLDAAIRGGRAWLAAYALRLGATGLTFFDDEVVEYFGEDPGRVGVMFLLAVGRPPPR